MRWGDADQHINNCSHTPNAFQNFTKKVLVFTWHLHCKAMLCDADSGAVTPDTQVT